MYEVANTSLSLESWWQFNKTKGILGPKPVPPVKSVVIQYFETRKPHSTRTLTPTFMNERSANGLCYFCDEPYTVGHNLMHKKLQERFKGLIIASKGFMIFSH